MGEDAKTKPVGAPTEGKDKRQFIVKRFNDNTFHILQGMKMLTPKAMATIQAYFCYLNYKEIGHNKSNAITLACRDANISEPTLYTFLKKLTKIPL